MIIVIMTLNLNLIVLMIGLIILTRIMISLWQPGQSVYTNVIFAPAANVLAWY